MKSSKLLTSSLSSYLGKEGFVPAAYLKKIGAARHSVLARHTREKAQRPNSQVLSHLEETIMEEPGIKMKDSMKKKKKEKENLFQFDESLRKFIYF